MTPIKMTRERRLGRKPVFTIRLRLPRLLKEPLGAFEAANQLDAAAEAMRDAAREGDVVELDIREDKNA